MTTKRKLLIVGGAGYIGAVLSNLLARSGQSFTIYDTLLYGQAPPGKMLLGTNGEFVRGDICDPKDLIPHVDEADDIVWLAARVGDGACDHDPDKATAVNYESVEWLCEHTSGKHVVFASSASIYGQADGHVNEDAELAPLSLYAETKVQAEKVLLESDNRVTILRLGTAYGVRPYTRIRLDLVVQAMVRNALRKGEIQVYGAERWRPLIHIEDVARAIITAIGRNRHPYFEKDGKAVFNLATSNHTLLDIAQCIAAVLKAELEKEVAISEHSIEYDLRDYRVNACRAVQAGLIPAYPISLDYGVIEAMFFLFMGHRLPNLGIPQHYSNIGILERLERIYGGKI